MYLHIHSNDAYIWCFSNINIIDIGHTCIHHLTRAAAVNEFLHGASYALSHACLAGQVPAYSYPSMTTGEYHCHWRLMCVHALENIIGSTRAATQTWRIQTKAPQILFYNVFLAHWQAIRTLRTRTTATPMLRATRTARDTPTRMFRVSPSARATAWANPTLATLCTVPSVSLTAAAEKWELSLAQSSYRWS